MGFHYNMKSISAELGISVTQRFLPNWVFPLQRPGPLSKLIRSCPFLERFSAHLDFFPSTVSNLIALHDNSASHRERHQILESTAWFPNHGLKCQEEEGEEKRLSSQPLCSASYLWPSMLTDLFLVETKTQGGQGETQSCQHHRHQFSFKR